MRELSLLRLTHDRQHVVLRDSASGEEFRIKVDSRLRAAMRNDQARPGQLEITMQSTLSPRDIQARIRRGESPDAVADSAGVSVDRIISFAIPVLAEREHIAERSRTAIVRRKHVDGPPAQLGDAVDEALLDDGRSAEAASWDAWKREDGKWVVALTPFDGAEPATFTYDVQSRYVIPDSEASRLLVGDVPASFSAEMAIADALVEHQSESPEQEVSVRTAAVTSIKQARDRRAQEQLTLTEAEADGEVAMPRLDDDGDGESDERSDDPPAEPEPVRHDVAVNDSTPADESEHRRKRHERRRVPSWDEIMFGNKSD